MSNDEVLISFPGISLAEANVHAQKLADDLKDTDRDLKVEIRKEAADTQDFGATLVLILGTAAATKVASGIARWIARHSGARVMLKTKDGTELLIENSDSAAAAKIAAALRSAL